MFLNLYIKKIITLGIFFAFLANTLGPLPLAYAQLASASGYASRDFDIQLPVPGSMISTTPAYVPLTLKGLIIHPENALKFDFLMDTGNSHLKGGALSDEALKIMKYFLTALTIPEDDLWVNLSPYEKGRIIQDNFGQTIMGRDLLAEDYILKQLTSSLIYPEKSLGKEFWQQVYSKAAKEYGTTQIPVNTFNKVWIVPSEAVVWEHDGKVLIVKSHLKVMLEEDYLSMAKHANVGVTEGGASPASAGFAEHAGETRGQDPNINRLGSQIVRKIVLPVLEKEVNEGQNFSQLRQMFQAMILATWYKKALKTSILNKVYSNKKKTRGVDDINTGDIQSIYQQYLKAFKKGAFNYIKEDLDPATGQTIPRKYFSGGFSVGRGLLALLLVLGSLSLPQERALAQSAGQTMDITMQVAQVSTAIPGPETFNIIPKEQVTKAIDQARVHKLEVDPNLLYSLCVMIDNKQVFDFLQSYLASLNVKGKNKLTDDPAYSDRLSAFKKGMEAYFASHADLQYFEGVYARMNRSFRSVFLDVLITGLKTDDFNIFLYQLDEGDCFRIYIWAHSLQLLDDKFGEFLYKGLWPRAHDKDRGTPQSHAMLSPSAQGAPSAAMVSINDIKIAVWTRTGNAGELVSMLDNSNGTIRLHALEALTSMLGNLVDKGGTIAPSLLDSVLGMLKDESKDVRLSVERFLLNPRLRVSRIQKVNAYIAVLSAVHPNTVTPSSARINAIEHLGRSSDPDVGNILLPLLGLSTKRLYWAEIPVIYEALAKLGYGAAEMRLRAYEEYGRQQVTADLDQIKLKYGPRLNVLPSQDRDFLYTMFGVQAKAYWLEGYHTGISVWGTKPTVILGDKLDAAMQSNAEDLVKLLADETASVRRSAMNEIDKLPITSERRFDILKNALEIKRGDIRTWAVKGLGNTGTIEAIWPLLSSLNRLNEMDSMEERMSVFLDARASLKKLNDSVEDKGAILRIYVEALNRSGDFAGVYDIVDALIDLWNKTSSSVVKEDIIGVLSRISQGPDLHVGRMVRSVLYEINKKKQQSERISSDAAVLALLNINTIKNLIAESMDPTEEVRLRLPWVWIVEALKDVKIKLWVGFVKNNIMALRSMDTEAAIMYITDLLQGDMNTRRVAILAIDKLDVDPVILEILNRFKTSLNNDVKNWSRQKLAKLGENYQVVLGLQQSLDTMLPQFEVEGDSAMLNNRAEEQNPYEIADEILRSDKRSFEPAETHHLGDALRSARSFIDMQRDVPITEIYKEMRDYNIPETYLISALLYFLSSSVERDQVRAAALIYTLYLDSKKKLTQEAVVKDINNPLQEGLVDPRAGYLRDAFKQAGKVLDKLNGGDMATLADNTPGGIALNAKMLDLQIKRDGHGVPLPMTQQSLDAVNIQGFVPQIISIQPVNLSVLLGLDPAH